MLSSSIIIMLIVNTGKLTNRNLIQEHKEILNELIGG